MYRVITLTGSIWLMYGALIHASPDVRAVKSPRLVSLSPSITALCYQIGAGDHLAGVTRYCPLPTGLDHAPVSVGGALDPDLERILDLHPHWVIAGTLLPEPTRQKMRALGLTLKIVRQDTFHDVFEQSRWLAQKTGSTAALPGIASAQAVVNRPPPLPRSQNAVMTFSPNFTTIAGPGTFGDQLLRATGVVNLGAAFSRPWPAISREWLLSQDPDWIIGASFAPESKNHQIRESWLKRWRKDPVLSHLNAVQKGKLLIVGGNRLGIPSLELVEVLEEWHRSFGDTDDG